MLHGRAAAWAELPRIDASSAAAPPSPAKSPDQPTVYIDIPTPSTGLDTSRKHSMPARKIFGHRDGFTVDSVLALQDLTTQNPFFTAALLAFFIRRARAPLNSSIVGWLLNRRNRTWGISISGILFCLSVLKRASDYLSFKARNNGVDDKYDWTKEIVLVTGASSGIGGRVCQMLTDRGIKVVGLDVQQPLYPVPARMKFYICDISKREKVIEVADTIRSEVGAPTVLLNNAGIGESFPLSTSLRHARLLTISPGRAGFIVDMKEKDIQAVMNINALCHYYTVQAFLPSMMQKGHGHVLTVASMASYVSPPGISAYGMSKAAALAFHETLTMELKLVHKTPKIRTSMINPLWTKTPLLDEGVKQGGKQGPKTMHVDTVAEGIVDIILSGKSTHLMLPRAVTLGSLMRGMPDWLHWGAMVRNAKDMEEFDSSMMVTPSSAI